MSTNISKKKRDDLLDKIKQIRAFIAAAPQDENTGNLLSYLSDLEKDVNGKKYGLVFEEHREKIDEVLDTHTPVLSEEKDLFIDNGGQMNFLIEGDNLASLKLLEKTHKGKIDLIYIDPPYNTQNGDFMYDDTFVSADDLFQHSKWLSFMKKRLLLCRKLLANRGFIFISIDDNEAPHLKALCDEIFGEENYEKTDYDVIFKSAKYNHVRNEIDTETMQERGRRKRPQDGDEEKTHLCIRLAKGENRFLAVHESNHYGITLKCIIDYLNEQFKKFNEDGNDPYHYTIESQIMPGEDFLSSIKRAKTMSVLKLTVYKDDIKDGFMRFAGRTDIADEVDICLKRPKGYKCFPENLIKEYFKDSQDKAKGKIKRIKIIGTNDAGSFEVDTNITGMKHLSAVIVKTKIFSKFDSSFPQPDTE